MTLDMLHRTGNRRRHTAKNLKRVSTMSLDNAYGSGPMGDKSTVANQEEVVAYGLVICLLSLLILICLLW
jgi:hypothetical protein